MTDIRNLSETKKQVIDTVREAGELLLSYYGRKISSRSKGGLDFATVADDAVDKFLREKLAAKFPSTKLLTEETAPADYSSLKNEENLWIIDPIDGTTNFSRGIEPFCISIGLVSRGQTLLGVIFEPTNGNLYHATRDTEFAYMNDDILKVSETQNFEESYIVTGLPWGGKKRKEVYNYIGRIYPKVRTMGIRGSAAQDLCELAKGTIDAFFIAGIKPWDIAAGTLFALKAGGKFTNMKGEPGNIFEEDVIFSNSRLHEKLLDTLH